MPLTKICLQIINLLFISNNFFFEILLCVWQWTWKWPLILNFLLRDECLESHTTSSTLTFGHVVFQLGVCNSIFISPMDLDEGCFLNKQITNQTCSWNKGIQYFCREIGYYIYLWFNIIVMLSANRSLSW